MTGPFTLSLVRPKLNSVNGFVRPPIGTPPSTQVRSTRSEDTHCISHGFWLMNVL